MVSHVSNPVKRLLRVRLWHLLALTAITAGGLAFWRVHVAPYLAQEVGRQRVADLGGRVVAEPASPEWLGRFIGQDRFHRVVEVHLEHSRIEDRDLQALHDLPFLQRLYLAGTQVTDEGVRHLADLPDLRRLSLWRTNVSDGCLKWVRRCERLEALDIHDTCITDRGLAQLRGLSGMQFLKLGGPIDGSGLQHVATLSNLQVLDLSRARIVAEAWANLEGMPVRTLVLPRSMPGAMLAVVAELPALEEMPHTLFEGCRDEDVAQLANHPRLRKLRMEGIELTDAAMQTLSTLPRLEDITLYGSLTDISLQTLGNFRSLQNVDVSGRFRSPALREFLSKHPQLRGELRTSIYPGQLDHDNLAVSWLVNSQLQRSYQSRVAPYHRTRIVWPATPSDLPERVLVPAVEQMPRLTHLSLYAPRVAGEKQLNYDLSPLAGAEDLQELQFHNVRPRDWKPLGEIPNLVELLVFVRGLTDDDLKQMELPHSLRECTFASSNITADGIAHLQRRFPHVQISAGGLNEREEFSGVFSCRDPGIATLQDAFSKPAVHSIHIQDTSQSLDLSVGAMRTHLNALELRPRRDVWPVWKNYPAKLHLESLSVRSSLFSDVELAQISQPAALRRVNLTDTRVSDVGLEFLSRCTGLRSLTIDGRASFWQIGGGGYVTGRTLSALARCPQLESLSLRHTRLHDNYIDTFPALPNLEILQLEGTDVGDATMKSLAEKIPRLKVLGLAYTDITDEGIKHIVQLSELESLDLRGTDVSGSSLLLLKQLRKLKMLRFEVAKDEEHYLEMFQHYRKDVRVKSR